MEKLKKFIPPAVFIALFYLLLHFIGIGCPIKFISGISCPGCGMTRAALSLLQLDFASAFYYHPLFPLVFVMGGSFVLNAFEKLPKKIFDIIIYVCCGLFVLVWIIRMFAGNGDIVSFHPENSIFARIIDFIFRH